MEVMITQHDNGASHIAVEGGNTTITNVAGLSVMIGGVQVDITDLVKKHICKLGINDKMAADIPLLPWRLVMKIRKDATDSSYFTYLEDHKRKFDRTLKIIKEQENTWMDYAINFNSTLSRTRYQGTFVAHNWHDFIPTGPYRDDWSRTNLNFGELVDFIMFNGANYFRKGPPNHCIGWFLNLSDDDIKYLDRFYVDDDDKYSAYFEKIYNNHISPSIIYRRKECNMKFEC
jgi:hypothetical protein